MQPIGTTTANEVPPAIVPPEDVSQLEGLFSQELLGATTMSNPAGPSTDYASIATSIVEEFKLRGEQSDINIAVSVMDLAEGIATGLDTLDVTDPAAVSAFQAILESVMAVAVEAQDLQHPVFGLLAGMPDTASAALSFAKADPNEHDPTAGAALIATVSEALSSVAAGFGQVASGQADLMTVSMEELGRMAETYGHVVGQVTAAGLEVVSLTEAAAPPVGGEGEEEPGILADTTPLDATALTTEPIPESQGGEDIALSDPSAEPPDDLGDLTFSKPLSDGTDPGDGTDPLVEEDTGFGLDELFNEDPASDTSSVEEPSLEDILGADDLFETAPEDETEFSDDNPSEDISALVDPFDPMESIEDVADITEPTEEYSEGLSSDPSTDFSRSDENQAILEDRFINLYEKLMEKQISFKERVEAFKTDNQNAGKG